MDQMDQQLERILHDDYLAGLPELSIDDLRVRRSECQEVETKLSYLRRLVQGRHDIVIGELKRRQGGGDPADVAQLVDQLPEILADRIRGPGSGRLPTSLEPGEMSSRFLDRLDAIAEAVPLDAPDAAEVADLERAAGELSDLEGDVSSLRRAMFDRIDAVEDEITRRYRDGEAHVEDLLGEQST